MKRKTVMTAVLCCCFVICMAMVADLTGQWTGNVNLPDGSQHAISYKFKTEGDKLTGSVDSPQGEIAITDGKVSGTTFTFNVPLQGMNIPHAGKYYGDSIGIDIDFNGNKMHSTFKRVVSK